MTRRSTERSIRALAATAVVVVAAACGGGNAPATPTANIGVSASPTVVRSTATPALSPEEQVKAAYIAYWDAYSAALLNLDPSPVSALVVADELERIKKEIESLRAQGVAARVVVDHDFAVVEVMSDSAVIIDRFVDRSFYVDPVTKNPPTASNEGRTFTDTFRLRRTGDGRWVVFQSTRQR